MSAHMLRRSENVSCGEISNRLGKFAIGTLVAAVAILTACVPALSQISHGRILGAVTDPSGAAIPGATVVVRNTQTNVSRTLTTDSDGAFVVSALIPGTYNVKASAQGFKTAEHQGVVVQVGRDIRVNVSLQLGTTSQTVTVTEAAPLVDTTNATLGGTLTSTQITDLPLNGRNFQNLITLRPGVVIQPGGSAWTQSTNGLRAAQTVYYVDGLMDNDYNVGWTVVNAPTPITEAGSILPIDAIQEFNLEQNPKAEFGWKAGEVINVGIKSGGNSFHGSAYAFGRDGAWDARNYFNPVGTPQLALTLENFGATVGGPILKNKLFFFAGYEGRRDLIGNSFPLGVPETVSQTPADPANSIPDAEAALTAAGVPISSVSVKLLSLFPPNPSSSSTIFTGFPNTDRSDNGIARIDYHINSRNTLSGMLFVSDYYGVGEDRPYVNQAFLSTMPMKNWVNNYSWIWMPNSRWVNEARFGFNRMTQGILNGDLNVPVTTYGLNTGITFPGGLPTIDIGANFELGTSFPRPIYNGPSPLYDWLDNVSYIRGKHTFKFGAELSWIHADAAGYALGRGWINFLGGGTPGIANSTPLEDFLSGNSTFALQLVGNPSRHLRQWAYAAFVQDDWRITPRLTLNLGLRYAYFAPPTERNGLIGNFCPSLPNNVGVTSCPATGLEQVGQQISNVFQPDRTNFSPRLGLAWDPTGSGKTVIRAGGAILYDHPFLGEFFGQLATQNGPATGIGTIPTGFQLSSDGGATFVPGPGKIASGAIFTVPGPSEWNSVVFPSSTNLACVGPGPGVCNILGVVPNFKTPYVANWNVGIEHSFTSSLGLDVEYVGNHGGRLPTITNINQPANPLVNPNGPYSAQFPYLGFINMISNIGYSNYNGLQVTLTQHMSHGLSFIAGYTYSHALDVSSLDAFALMPQNSLNPSADYASSDFDMRHHFTLTMTYNIPGIKSPLQLLQGWQINSIVTLETGQPWTVGDTSHNISLTNDLTDRWDFFGNPSDFKSGPTAIPYCSGAFETPDGVTCTEYPFNAPPVTLSAAQSEPYRQHCAAVAADATPGGTLDQFGCYVKGNSVMVPPAFGTFGSMGRNLFRDSGFRNWDFSLFKNWKFGEGLTGQFRAEFFNILNHPSFANPYGGPTGFGTVGYWNPAAPGLFGCGCATPDFASGNPIVGSGDARAIQLGFKLLF